MAKEAKEQESILNRIPECQEILNNPLWHLCRSNTENAMSNFWAYLMKIHGNNLEIILGKTEAKKYKGYGKVIEIRREKDHMDLQIIFNNNAIVVIENKFKSLADLKQIDSYKEKIKKKHPINHFYLITPTQSDGTDKDQQTTSLSYGTVCKNIKNFLKKEKNDIFKKYIKLLENIVQIWKKIEEEKNRYKLCLFWKKDPKDDPQTANDVEVLVEEKLYALITKNLASDYQNKLLKRKSKEIIQETGFSNATPNMSWKVKYQNNKYSKGVQIQGGQFRLFVMNEDPKGTIDEKELKKWLKELYPNQEPHWDNRAPYCKFKTWFKYKYFKIDSEKTLKDNLKKVFNYWKNQSH